MTDHELDAIPGSLAATLCSPCMEAAGETAGAPDGYRIAASSEEWWYSDAADTCDACGTASPELFQGWFLPIENPPHPAI